MTRRASVSPPGFDAADLQRLLRGGFRLAVAESLTGGLLADAIVTVPGASRVFSGAVVAYDTHLKHSLLDVDANLLAERGPVDPAVAEQMARGVRRICAVPHAPGETSLPADLGIATTGVAGPAPDPQTGQPAGTVWVGVSSSLGERSRRFDLPGDREAVRSGAVEAALSELREELERLQDRD